jgi:hypothetical protein
MTLVYVRLIIWKQMSFSSVPTRYQAGVREGLRQRGYNIYGNKI